MQEWSFVAAPPEWIRKEKLKARELRSSQWWKNQLGRGVCYHCEQSFSPQDLTMDHLIPLVRGGRSSRQNCVPSCKPCNTQKSYLTRAEWVLQQELQKSSSLSDLS